ncbi:MAG: hypothetical protein JO269_10980 [Burkholderiaceae bacterium]|nr:hypothetical protein [Burkholderiaceae bacterium]
MRRVTAASILMLFTLSAQAGGLSDWFTGIVGRFSPQGRGHDAQAKQFDESLRQVSEFMNKHMPEAIDQDTRLDRVSAEPGSHFSYHYTLLNRTGSDADKEAFADSIRPQIKSNLCSNAQVRNFFNHGVTVAYMYQGIDGKPIGGAEFKPNTCDDAKMTSSL